MKAFAPIIAAWVTALSIHLLRRGRLGAKVQDIPNSRSLHVAPVPRVGGIGLMAGIASAWAMQPEALDWWLLLPLALLFLVSMLDDLYSLPVRQRLATHLVAAILLAVGGGVYSAYGPWLALAVVLFAVWMTNLYNFMDGSDGLAGGMALLGFGACGIAAAMAGDDAMALLNLSVSAAALGFLWFNFPTARVFMGDAGSIPLGFLVAALGMRGWLMGCWELWFPLLVFSPFIADASITLLRRTLRGAKVTEAHREHYYQRAIRMGWSHRRVAVAGYLLMLASGVSALLAVGEALPWLLFGIWLSIYAVLMYWLDRRWRSHGEPN
jgi:UDP-N-acetylmuramyl pentapeptide phosphotransferase/UDP-N-acetylglucosamine-1-phosphate transferase